MAYVSGTATTYANLLSAIQAALTSNGWTLSSGILSKDTTFVNLRVDNPFSSGSQNALIASIGNSASGGSLTGSLPTLGVKIGPFQTSSGPADLIFPCSYKIFINTAPDEVYIVVGYNTNMYQWMGFGVSPAAGSPGNGTWLSGTFGQPATGTTPVATPYGSNSTFYINNIGGGSASAQNISAGLFFNNYAAGTNLYPATNALMHTGSTGDSGWSQSISTDNIPTAYEGNCDLLRKSPNLWNLQSTLFKILISITAASNKVRIVGELKHSRHLKINYMNPETIITLGTDKWMVFPFFKKGTQELTAYADDTGYFGFAIRYDGP